MTAHSTDHTIGIPAITDALSTVVWPPRLTPILHSSLRDWNGKTKNRSEAESKKRPQRAFGALLPPPENNNASHKTNEQCRQLYREH